MTHSARRRLFLTTALAGTLLHAAAHAADLPVVGMDGGATISPITTPGPPAVTTGLKVDLNNASRIIDWTSFDVGANKAVNFTTADTVGKYAVLNRVTTNDASDIFGTITSTSNIAVWLSNPSGITFGATGSFSGSSLVLTTATVNPTDWGNAIASNDSENFVVRLTGAPVLVTNMMTGVTTGAIQLLTGSTITTTSGRFAAAAQSVTAAGQIAAAGSEATLVAATDLALPFGAGSPMGVRIDKGTSVGRVTVQGTAVIDANVIRLAGASAGAQAAYLLQVDDGAQLTASAVGGKVVLVAGVPAADGVTLGTGAGTDVTGDASIQYDGKISATGTGATVVLDALGGVVTATANGRITADGTIGITARNGGIAEAASLTSTTGNVGISAGGATAVQGAVSAGGNYGARGKVLTLGTPGTAILQQAKGTVQLTATDGLLSGLDGLTVQSGSAGANAKLELIQSDPADPGGPGGIVFAPGTELIGGTFAGPPAVYGVGADVVVSAIQAGKPLTLGNIKAHALTLPDNLTGTITAGNIVVNDTLTLNTSDAIRLQSGTSRTGDVALTAMGEVTGLGRATAATDGRLSTGYDRANLTALAAGKAVTVAASNAQLGTVIAGAGTSIVAGEQVKVEAKAIDVGSATAANGALRLISTVGEVRLDSGGGSNATVDAATSARIGSLTATTGNVFATATKGDVTGLARATEATDGRLVTGYDRAALAATGGITVTAGSGYAQLGTVTAGTGTTSAASDQIAADARAIDVSSATARNGALRLTSTAGEVRILTGIGETGATVRAATSARIDSLTATTGDLSVTATAGDVTGLALPTAATDGRLLAGYGLAALAASAATGTVAVKAAAGNVQIGTATAGLGTTPLAGDQLVVDAQAIDATTATAQNGAFRLTSTAGVVRLGTGAGGTSGTVDAATSTRIGSLVTRTGSIAVTARNGDATGLALDAPATDGRLVAGYGRADLIAQAADRTIAVTANAGTTQLGAVTAGTGTTTPSGDQIAVDARAIDAVTTDARNGALRLTSKIGEVRVASGHGGTDATVGAATSARVGDLTSRTGAIAITATGGDATGFALATAATDSRPEAGYGLTTLDAGTKIRVAASDDVQLNTIRAATDIDIDAHPADPATATADAIAWAAGPVTATAGHYRITGGSVVLGAPGSIGQSAGADLIVRSLAGDIAGGAGLSLASGVGSTAAANQLILYSAVAIALPSDSTLTAGAGRYADIGLAAAPGSTVTLGNASARRIGTAGIDASQPTGYRIDTRLALPNPIAAHKLVTAADLVIDTTANGTVADILLDEAQSTGGGINLATLGDVKGHLLPGPSALYQRAKLTGFDGVVITSSLALLDTVIAGTGIDIGAGRLDALGITGNAGDVVLRTSGDMRVDSVIAHGNGGNGLATLLADPTINLSAYATPGAIGSAGDLYAASAGDITGTAASATRLANFTATNGAVTILSDATATDKGLLALDTVIARGAAAGHDYASLTGRQIEVATNLESTAGSIFANARELGSQTQVGATITRAAAAAAQDVTIAIGYGTAPAGTADNGSLRLGTVQTTSGNVSVTTPDGSVTGLAGSADGVDPAHARAAVSAGGNVTVTAGKLVQLGELSGQDVTVAAGDDVLADVAQQGTVAHQDGAIDIAHLVTRGMLTLTAAHGATADGVSGIRLGALASGLPDGGIASQAGTAATLRTLGTLGDVVVADGLTAQGDLTVAGIAGIRASTLTSATGGISLTATGGDITGLVLPVASTDGRLIAGYGRADLATQAAGQSITASAAAGTAQLGTVSAGTGTNVVAGDQIAIDARAIDILDATARNGALRLTSTIGEARLAAGTAGTKATIDSTTNARIGTLTTRTGSIAITAAAGDVTGLLLPAAATDGRPIPAYGRADLTAQAAAADVTVTANKGTAQLGIVMAGMDDTTATSGGIAVDAALIDVGTAIAQNAALRLASSVGEVRLVTGTAGTDAHIGAATNARIGALTTRTGSILTTANAGDVTGLARPAAADDGRIVPAYDRANLTAQAAGTGIAVTAAAGTAQLGPLTAGAGDMTTTPGGIAVDARAIDVTTATAQNATLRMTSTGGEVRLATGAAGTDAMIAAATNARLGMLTTRTGAIAVTATAGDVTGLVRPSPAGDGRIVAAYDRAALTALAVAQTIAVKAAAGTAQLDTVLAGAGPGTSAGDEIAVDGQAIDVTSAAAQNGALRLTSTLTETRLATGAAGTDATIQAATSARLGALTARTGSIAAAANSGDVTGLMLATPATDGRLVPTYGRADLTAWAADAKIAVRAAAGSVQLGAAAAGGQVAVDAQAIDVTSAAAQNGALRLSSTDGEVRLITGVAGTDATIGARRHARIGKLTAGTGSISVTAAIGDVTGLALAVDAADGRLVPAYGRADLTAQAPATNVTVAAAGTAQLGTVAAGAGDMTVTIGGIGVAANAIDVISANAQNAALQLTSTGGETRLATGTAGTDATILAANNARIGTLTTHTGSIAVTATAGDVAGLALAPAATDGRLSTEDGRADLIAQGAGTNVTVKAAAGTAQLGTVTAGAGDTIAPVGGIAVDARAIDVATATARNAALRLASTGGDVRLATGVASTDATIAAATNARIGTLAARTGSVAVTAATGDATGLALAAPTADGRQVPAFGRADLTALTAARTVNVAAAGTAQLGVVAAGTGDTTAITGGIGVTAGAVDIVTATAQNAALKLTSTIGETRLTNGTAGTDATIAAATSARIGALATRTGSIAITAATGDVTGLALTAPATDGRLAASYGRADLAALAAAKTIAVTAAAGAAQLGAVAAGTGTAAAGEQIAVDARAIDVAAATAGDGALRLASTAGETRLATGMAATDATIRSATSARIGDLSARTGGIAVTATMGDVTGLAGAKLADGRPIDIYGRANLTALAAARTITVSAELGTAQLGAAAAGTGTGTGTGDQLTVRARAIDVTTATAQNGGMRLTSTAGDTRVMTAAAGTDATIDAAASARIQSLTARTGTILVTAHGTAPATQGLYVGQSLEAPGAITLVSAGDIGLPPQAGVIVSNNMVVLRNSGSGGTLIGAGAEGTGFDLTAAEVNSIGAPRLVIDSADRAVGIGGLKVAAAAGKTDVDLLGTGSFTLDGAITNDSGSARTLQIGGAAASVDAPGEAAIEAGTTLARSITAEIDNGASIDWTGGTVDLRAATILFGNNALRTATVGAPEAVAVNQVARANSPLYIGAINTKDQNKVFLTALKLRVAYSGYALFQNTNVPAVPAGVMIGGQDRSVTALALQLYSTGETPANSFALFGTINGFDGRTAGLLPAGVIEFADLSPRAVRITQANSRVNGCVVGSQEGCLVTNAPPTNFQLFDERQILLFGTADDAGLTFDPLIGTNNESLIGDIDSGTLGINSIDCSAPGTRDCPAAGEKP